VAPAFAPCTLHRVAGQVVASASALAGHLAAFDGEYVNLAPLFQRLALDIIGRALLPRLVYTRAVIDEVLRLSRPPS
jgi:cytochrome P450